MKKSSLFAISALFAGSLFAQTGTMPVVMEEDIINAKDADEMPLYLHSECNKQSDYETRKRCADRKMLEYVYKNVQYPSDARQKGLQGDAVVTFVVEKDGTMSGLRIISHPGGGVGEEALRVMRLIQSKGVVWKPGKKADMPVRVQFSMPVRFKLE
ncbi:MAG: energy transducer TonB [Saprospiraceae bacterium]|nr:energy transducer TonB [Saprospiraceae bacterium]HRD83354.1 energy transducer TonB [Saprospiraceae bacterium]